jgi:Tol biopolymer transport system component
MRLDASVSEDGRLVFSILTWVINLYSAPLDAITGKAGGEPQAVSRDSQTKHMLNVTPDGSKAVYLAFSELKQSPSIELRLRDIPSGRETALSSCASWEKSPRISADGSMIAYRDGAPDGAAAFISTPAGDKRKICSKYRILRFFPQLRDVLGLYGGNRLVRQRVSDGSQDPVVTAQTGTIADARFSYDGRWVAFVLDRPGGRSGLYIAPVRESAVPESWRMPVEESDTPRSAEPCWSPDDELLYYLSERDGANCVWARRFDPLSQRLSGEPFAVLHTHTARCCFVGPRRPWGLNVTKDRLYMLMAEGKANV